MNLLKVIELEVEIRELERQNEILAKRSNEWQERACDAELALQDLRRVWRQWVKSWPHGRAVDLAAALEDELLQ